MTRSFFITFILIAAAIAVFAWFSKQVADESPTEIVIEKHECPVDVFTCPDGSTVSRIPPACDFAACPEIPVTLPGEEEGVYCPMDAKECPDGSYVSRQGPNCEFAPCPSE